MFPSFRTFPDVWMKKFKQTRHLPLVVGFLLQAIMSPQVHGPLLEGGDALKTEQSHGKSTSISNWSTVNDWPVKGPLPLKEETENNTISFGQFWSLRKLKLKRYKTRIKRKKILPKSIMTTSPMKSRRSEIGRSSAFRSVFHTLPRPTASTSCTSCNCWLRAMRLPKRTNGDEKKMENTPKKVCMLYKCWYLWTCSYTRLHD